MHLPRSVGWLVGRSVTLSDFHWVCVCAVHMRGMRQQNLAKKTYLLTYQPSYLLTYLPFSVIGMNSKRPLTPLTPSHLPCPRFKKQCCAFSVNLLFFPRNLWPNYNTKHQQFFGIGNERWDNVSLSGVVLNFNEFTYLQINLWKI